MVEFDEKTAKSLMMLHQSIKAAVLDIIESREKTDEHIEAVVSQMFGECLWEILTKGEAQDNIVHRMIESYKARH